MRYTNINEAVAILKQRDPSFTKDSLQKKGQRGTWPRVMDADGNWAYAVPDPEEDHRDIRENPKKPTPGELGYEFTSRQYQASILEAFPEETPVAEQKENGEVVFTLEDSPEFPSVEEQIRAQREKDSESRQRTEFLQENDNYTAHGISVNDPEVQSVADLMDYLSIDKKQWEVSDFQAKSWDVTMKVKIPIRDENGEYVIQNGRYATYHQPFKVTNFGITAKFRRKLIGMVKPVVDHTPVMIPDPVVNRSVEIILVVPDTQHGFFWEDGHRKLTPLHDRRAIDAVWQLADYLRPDGIVHLGDGPDFAEFSLKYRRGKEHDDTTQPAINELYFDNKRFRETCQRMWMLTGNHEDRLPRLLQERAACLDQLRPAYNVTGEEPEIPDPLLEIRRVLSLDNLDIELKGPYGKEDLWLWDGRVRFVHDPGVLRGGGGKTVSALLPKISVTTIFGHIHRMEYAAKTAHDAPGGPRVVQACSAGCLCRIDGAVPAANQKPDWQHGCSIVTCDEDGNVHVQPIPLVNGTLSYNGRVFKGRDLGPQIAEAIGYPQAA